MLKERLQLYLNPDELAWLREQAEVRRVSLGQLVRELILAAMVSRGD